MFVLASTFAGCFAQNRYCRDHGYPELEYLARIWSLDWKESRGISGKLSDAYLAGRSILATQEALEKRSEELVTERWHVIEAVASALLAKGLEPVKPLKSGSLWAKGTSARYLTGDEVVEIIARFGIAVCPNANGGLPPRKRPRKAATRWETTVHSGTVDGRRGRQTAGR